MRFVKPESLDKDSIILDVRGADEYAHERLALPHIVIKADKVCLLYTSPSPRDCS